MPGRAMLRACAPHSASAPSAALQLDGRGFLTVLGGFLLVLPGFVTDVLGALLLLPPTQILIGAALRRAGSADTRAGRSRASSTCQPDQWRQVPEKRISPQARPRRRLRNLARSCRTWGLC